jgi:uncharacterized protein (DUF1810 family)
MSKLDRFRRAQDDLNSGFEPALEEIRAGRKRGHWIWYIFPQLDGLGMSSMARAYAIEGEAEAEAYLRDPHLRERLLTMTRAVADQLLPTTTGAADQPGAGSASSGAQPALRLGTLMGSEIDAKKLVSSLTLFAEVARRLAAEDPGSDDAKEYASMATTASHILSIASSQGYPPCVFTRRVLGLE